MQKEIKKIERNEKRNSNVRKEKKERKQNDNGNNNSDNSDEKKEKKDKYDDISDEETTPVTPERLCIRKHLKVGLKNRLIARMTLIPHMASYLCPLYRKKKFLIGVYNERKVNKIHKLAKNRIKHYMKKAYKIEQLLKNDNTIKKRNKISLKEQKLKELELLTKKLESGDFEDIDFNPSWVKTSKNESNNNNSENNINQSNDNDNINENDDSDIDIIVQKEIDYYDKYELTEEETSLCEDNVLIWWNLRQIQTDLPLMRIVSFNIFIAMMSSCPSERVFSEFLNILTEKRSSMKHYHASMIHLCHGELTRQDGKV